MGSGFSAVLGFRGFPELDVSSVELPTKAACTSALSHKNMVWAPSVIQKGDMFYMYVSVGSEVWCGKAAHPLGPWENVLGDKPMISFDTTRYYHVIDAEALLMMMEKPIFIGDPVGDGLTVIVSEPG